MMPVGFGPGISAKRLRNIGAAVVLASAIVLVCWFL
jgi:hypothetical protein